MWVSRKHIIPTKNLSLYISNISPKIEQNNPIIIKIMYAEVFSQLASVMENMKIRMIVSGLNNKMRRLRSEWFEYNKADREKIINIFKASCISKFNNIYCNNHLSSSSYLLNNPTLILMDVCKF